MLGNALYSFLLVGGTVVTGTDVVVGGTGVVGSSVVVVVGGTVVTGSVCGRRKKTL